MAHVSESEERQQEVLEALWQHHEEGRPLSPARVTPEDRVALEARGWLRRGEMLLTDEGRGLAAAAIRRHRLAERLLADLLGRHREGEEEDACRLEHSLVQGLDERVCAFLGHPRICPHGHPIPEGACCEQPRRSIEAAILSLSAMRPGESGAVAYLAASEEGDLQKFLSMGIHPGDPIALVRKTPTLVFRSGHAQFAVDRELGGQIFVRKA